MSSFFVGKNLSLADELLDSNMLMKADPERYGPRFEAIKELRDHDDGSLHRGSDFRRVASLVNIPLANMAGILEPEFMKDKKTFYAWLDRAENKRYCTYDRRKGKRRSDMVTFQDGKEI